MTPFDITAKRGCFVTDDTVCSFRGKYAKTTRG